jgi:hypothetical protein
LITARENVLLRQKKAEMLRVGLQVCSLMYNTSLSNDKLADFIVSNRLRMLCRKLNRTLNQEPLLLQVTEKQMERFLLSRNRFEHHKRLIINELKVFNPVSDGNEEQLYK